MNRNRRIERMLHLASATQRPSILIIISFFLLILIPLPSSAAGDRDDIKLSKPSRPFIAMQVHILNGKNYREVDREIGDLKKQGYDVLILRVFHNKGDRFYPFVKHRSSEGVYFKTSHSPVVEDILTPIIPMAKKHGMKVFAWMTTRYADYGLKNRNNLKCKAYDFKRGLISYCKGLDLFNKEVIRHLEGLYRDLARYPLDGILFQDDLVLRHNEGFGRAASFLFQNELNYPLAPERLYKRVRTGDDGRLSVDYTEAFWEWAAWKNKHLLYVAKHLMNAVREVNPHINFMLNMMYEVAYNPSQALAWLSQSLDKAEKVGFDFYAIMAYHRQIQEELNIDFTESLEVIDQILNYATKKIKNPEQLLIKIQLLDWKENEVVTIDEVKKIIEKVAERDVNIILSPYTPNFPVDKVGFMVRNRYR